MSQGNVDSNKRHEKWWIITSALLVIAIIAGGIVLGLRQWGGVNPVEIALSSTTASTLEVYLSGAVANEGIYTLGEDCSLGDILQRAGGVTDEADSLKLKIRVPCIGESPFEQPQETKININTASADELQNLYGIGPVKAQAIIDYRNEKGFFYTIEELVNVHGIGPGTLNKIRDDITVVS